jgi:hypothetical protein
LPAFVAIQLWEWALGLGGRTCTTINKRRFPGQRITFSNSQQIADGIDQSTGILRSVSYPHNCSLLTIGKVVESDHDGERYMLGVCHCVQSRNPDRGPYLRNAYCTALPFSVSGVNSEDNS